jgi:asparagine synthase (glutamine-hydrolysing)
VKLVGPLPSFQENIRKLDADRRVQAHINLKPELLREVRYPYFDRDLLEFIYATPQEQIVGVGQRRFLMKRSLAGIVPDELLNRKRKEFVPPGPKKDSSTEWPSTVEIGRHIAGGSVRIIDPDRFVEALQKARCNEDVPIGSLKRTLTLESWLRHLATQGALTNSTPKNQRSYSRHSEQSEEPLPTPLVTKKPRDPARPNSLAS